MNAQNNPAQTSQIQITAAWLTTAVLFFTIVRFGLGTHAWYVETITIVALVDWVVASFVAWPFLHFVQSNIRALDSLSLAFRSQAGYCAAWGITYSLLLYYLVDTVNMWDPTLHLGAPLCSPLLVLPFVGTWATLRRLHQPSVRSVALLLLGYFTVSTSLFLLNWLMIYLYLFRID